MKAPALKESLVTDRQSRDGSQTNWRWLLAAGLLACLLAYPLVLVDVPPVLDYPNHLARYFLLAHPDDPVTSRMYETHWTILPNLGMDIAGAALLRVTDLHVGGRLLLAASLLLPVIGAVAYHRAAFGEWGWWPLASGLLAYNAAFFLGFMNFLLSLGLALLAGAMWISLQNRTPLVRAASGAAAAAILFFCHVFGVVFFAVLIGTYEAGLMWKRSKSGSLAMQDLLRASVIGLVALSPALVLYLLSPLQAGSASIGEWVGVGKLWRIFAPFMTTNANLTLITAVVVVSLFVLFRRKLEFALGAPLALAVLFLAFVAAPSSVKGGTFVDLRFALMIGLLLFAAVRPRLSTREALFTGTILAVLIAVRSLQVGTDWIEHRNDLADLRRAIEKVEPGARVMTMRGGPGHVLGSGPEHRSLPGIYRLDGHLGALLVSERKAFYPLLFADAAQQPLLVRPPFDQIAQPLSEPPEWASLFQRPTPEALQRAHYLRTWRQNFDYVLLIDPPAVVQSHTALSPLYQGRYAQLFRIDRN